jgi:hypothetical protein
VSPAPAAKAVLGVGARINSAIGMVVKGADGTYSTTDGQILVGAAGKPYRDNSANRYRDKQLGLQNAASQQPAGGINVASPQTAAPPERKLDVSKICKFGVKCSMQNSGCNRLHFAEDVLVALAKNKQ